MPKRVRFLLAVTLLILLSPSTSLACEPILPLVQIFGGTLLITKSLTFLGLAVLLKLIAFVYFERSMPWHRAVAYMLIANIVSSVIGVLAAFPVAVPAAFFIGVPLVYVISILPARRLTQRFNLRDRAQLNQYVVALISTALFITSVFFWGVARRAFSDESLGWYWALKLVYIYIALIISMGLTIFYEEWVVSRLTKRGREAAPFLTSVTRANLVTMLFIMGVSAAMILPERLKSPDFIGYVGTILTRAVALIG